MNTTAEALLHRSRNYCQYHDGHRRRASARPGKGALTCDTEKINSNNHFLFPAAAMADPAAELWLSSSLSLSSGVYIRSLFEWRDILSEEENVDGALRVEPGLPVGG